MRSRLWLPMFTVSVCQSVCHECTEWTRSGFTVQGNRQRRVKCMPRAVCTGSFGAAFTKCLWPLVNSEKKETHAYIVHLPLSFSLLGHSASSLATNATNEKLFTCMHAVSRYWFWRRLCVCLSVRRKSRILLIRNWCNLVGMCLMANARSDWKLVTFDLDLWPWELFSYFSSSGYIFRMALPSNFISGMVIQLPNV